MGIAPETGPHDDAPPSAGRGRPVDVVMVRPIAPRRVRLGGVGRGPGGGRRPGGVQDVGEDLDADGAATPMSRQGARGSR